METVRIPTIFAKFGFWHSDPAKIDRVNCLPEPFDVNPSRMVRRDGDEYLIVTPAAGVGMPWGRLAKMLVVMLATEAVAADSAEIVLPSAQHVLRLLGIEGKSGHYTDSVEESLRRLLGATFWTVERHNDSHEIAAAMAEAIDRGQRFPDHHIIDAFKIANGIRLFDGNGDPIRLWKDREPLRITLSKAFFDAAKAGLDLDRATWLGLSQSPVALDVYGWLNYRTVASGTVEIPSGAIVRQLGFTGLAHEAKGKIKLAVEGKGEKKGITAFWPELDVAFVEGKVELEGGSRSGWYATSSKDGAIVLGTVVRHVAQIAENAQVSGQELAERSKRRLAEKKARAEQAMKKMAESDPETWATEEVSVGGWGV